MAEAVAREKFACPACGAEGVWNPAKQAVVCPFCGTVSPVQKESSGAVVEHDLVTALRELPQDKRGWKAEKISVKCQSCQAITVFDPGRVAQRCEFCGSAQIVPYEQVKPPISPESLLPFTIEEGKVRESIRQWYASRWFAPNRFKTAALTDTVKGIYLPYWTFDAQVHADWTAESGYYYYTTETYRDSNGNTQTRQVQHTRWVPSSGSLDHFFDDELVCASRGVQEQLLRKVEPFPTKQVVCYDPSFVAGWIVEQYQLDLIGAAQKARDRMTQAMEGMCASQVPGDTSRNLNVDADFSAQTFKHILLPIWFLTYNYGTKTYQVAVNGVTGDIAGKHPLSAWKILFLIMSILIAGLIFYGIVNSR
jgi:ribosomal protein S27E